MMEVKEDRDEEETPKENDLKKRNWLHLEGHITSVTRVEEYRNIRVRVHFAKSNVMNKLRMSRSGNKKVHI